MLYLFRHYFLMLFLQTKPQDYPASQALQVILLITYLLVSVFTALVIFDVWGSIAHTILELAFLYAFTQLLLLNARERVHQTFNAFLGTGILIGVVTAVLAYALMDQNSDQPVSPSDFGVFSVVYFWMLVVYGHIVRHAIDVKLSAGVGIVLAYAIASIILRQYISMILGI